MTMPAKAPSSAPRPYSAPSNASRASVGSFHVMAALPSTPMPLRSGVPVSIPRDEVYYWTLRWQQDEAETVRELEKGEGVTFASGGDMIRWLLDPSDDS